MITITGITLKLWILFTQDPDLKAVEAFLEESDSVEEPANCVLENQPACSGGSNSKCCDNVGTKLKEIGLMVFGPRSSLKECGLLDQVSILRQTDRKTERQRDRKTNKQCRNQTQGDWTDGLRTKVFT
jgi:hypothetical protein